jgi:hypothetical protein
MRAKSENPHAANSLLLAAWLHQTPGCQTRRHHGLGLGPRVWVDLWARMVTIDYRLKKESWLGRTHCPNKSNIGIVCMISTFQHWQDLSTLRPWPSVGKCMLRSDPPAATVKMCESHAISESLAEALNLRPSLLFEHDLFKGQRQRILHIMLNYASHIFNSAKEEYTASSLEESLYAFSGDPCCYMLLLCTLVS